MPTPPLCSPFLRSPCRYTCRDKSLACLLGRLSSIYRVLEPSSTRRICARCSHQVYSKTKAQLDNAKRKHQQRSERVLGTQVKRSTRAAVRIAARVSLLLASYSYLDTKIITPWPSSTCSCVDLVFVHVSQTLVLFQVIRHSLVSHC